MDPTADAAGVGPGPRPAMGNNEEAAIAERHRRANTQVAHGAEARYVQYRKWARTHLERKSVLGKDFIKYLAVKEHYFGTYEDDMYYRAERIAQAKAKAAAKGGSSQQSMLPQSWYKSKKVIFGRGRVVRSR